MWSERKVNTVSNQPTASINDLFVRLLGDPSGNKGFLEQRIPFAQ